MRPQGKTAGREGTEVFAMFRLEDGTALENIWGKRMGVGEKGRCGGMEPHKRITGLLTIISTTIPIANANLWDF